MLDILPEIGDTETFTTFVRILQVDYDWIAEKLCECNNRDSPDASCHGNVDPFLVADNQLLGLQHSLIQAGIPFPPPHLVPRHVKVCGCTYFNQIIILALWPMKIFKKILGYLGCTDKTMFTRHGSWAVCCYSWYGWCWEVSFGC